MKGYPTLTPEQFCCQLQDEGVVEEATVSGDVTYRPPTKHSHVAIREVDFRGKLEFIGLEAARLEIADTSARHVRLLGLQCAEITFKMATVTNGLEILGGRTVDELTITDLQCDLLRLHIDIRCGLITGSCQIFDRLGMRTGYLMGSSFNACGLGFEQELFTSEQHWAAIQDLEWCERAPQGPCWRLAIAIFQDADGRYLWRGEGQQIPAGCRMISTGAIVYRVNPDERICIPVWLEYAGDLAALKENAHWWEPGRIWLSDIKAPYQKATVAFQALNPGKTFRTPEGTR